ncbi:VOC family protein [Pedobacter montanisoli]|uniref:Extradiol dioxygenase n=1 Tax=Pedobacter montanisoli TaxID=2923277 RepID=A0ABS9ZWP2_9SPHI|nr:extradiol dioxygenase [Pedobacter montanisoli]MCJ0742734.1 extradiol dioxygenase [Pedobacter montanisoli]
MTKEIWLNLPVSDVQQSTIFFKAIGFEVNTHAPNSEVMVSFKIGSKNFIVNLFRKDVFQSFTPYAVADVSDSLEMLISIDAESTEEVNELLEKAEKAGGKVFAKVAEQQGWMYGGGFTDLDGHKWNILYMDFSRMPQK